MINDPQSPCVCQNCNKFWRQDELKLIDDIFQRVAAGEIMPAGDCPECGALCQLKEPENIVEFLSTGNLTGEPKTVIELLQQCGNLLDKEESEEIIGPVIYKTDDGRYFRISLEAKINEISKYQATLVTVL